jgi:methyl-accepting chemotaxis protein
MGLRNSISKKFMVISGLVVLVLMTLTGRYLIENSVGSISNVIDSRGNALTNMMVSISKSYFEEYDYEALEDFANQMMQDSEVLFAGYFDEDDSAIGKTELNPDEFPDAFHIVAPVMDDSESKLGSLHVVFSLDALEKNKAETKKMVWISSILMIVLLVLSLSFLSVFVISRPLKKMMKTLEAVEAGNLDHNVNVNSSDEFGQMAKALNNAIDSMGKVFAESEESRVREAENATELKNNVDEILGGVDAASSGDLRYGISISGDDAIVDLNKGLDTFFSELNSNIELIDDNATTLSISSKETFEISNRIVSLAKDNSEQASSLSESADNVSFGVQAVAAATVELSASITEIAQNSAGAIQIVSSAVETASVAGESINRLRESGNEINTDVATITKIASQTNLLALNATIEAARAGDAGKGFAVVAEEVKDLARETGEAAEAIKTRIQTIQSDTANAVNSIERIVEIITEIQDLQAAIGSAVEEQSATTSEIERSMTNATTEMDLITGRISGLAASSNDTSDGLTSIQSSQEALMMISAELKNLAAHYQKKT